MDNSRHTDVATSRARRLLCVAVLFIGNTFASCCLSLLGPFFPVEAAEKGASETVVGFIFSCPELVVFLTSPLFGALLSKINPRFMCVIGLWVFGSCVILFGWLSESPPGWIFIGLCFATRVVEALGTGSYMTSCLTIAAGLFPDRKPTIYGLLETGVGVGSVIGPAIGGFLYECGGYAMPFWTMGGCVFIVGVTILIILPQNEHQEYNQVSLQSTFLLLRSPLVSLGVLCLTCNCYVLTVWVPGYAQYLQQFGLKMSTIGLVFLILAFTYIIASPLFSFLVPTKIPVIPVILTSLSALSLAMLLFGPSPFLTFLPRALWLPIFSSACLGFFSSIVYIGAISCIFTGIRQMGMNDDSQTQGLVSGLIMSALSLGYFIGPVIGGVLTDYFGFAWATTSGSVFCFMTLLVFTGYLCVQHRNKPSCILESDYQELDKIENYKRATIITADTESKRLIKQGTK